MKKYGLISTYTVKQFKIHKTKCNNDKVENIVNREFNNRKNLNVVVSDLTYVNVAFLKTNCNLNNINIFHTDRSNEFKNKIIDEVLETFKIKRSPSKKCCPYDNAVAEATYKIIKTEFAFNRIFNNFEKLERELFDYINWYNNRRLHGSLKYMTPEEYKNKSLFTAQK